MLLALDIGNSNIVIGVSANEKWKHQWRIQTDDDKTTDEYGVLLQSLFEEAGLRYVQFEQVIISSVVPQLTDTIAAVFKKRSNISPLILNGKVDTGITLQVGNTATVGADLIADAAGAFHKWGEDCIIVDFGTATTVMAVKKPGNFLGGAICSGLKVTIDALVGKAAQLSQIPMEPPPQVINGNTIEAMQSGLVLGHICMVEGLIDRMKKQLESQKVKVIATGGLSEKIGPHTDYFDIVDPMLTLDGLRIIMKRQGGTGNG